MEVQAGGVDAQSQVWVILFECSQFLGTVRTGAPCEVAGDSRLAQLQGTHLINEEDFCVFTFLVLQAAFERLLVIVLLQLVAQIGRPFVEAMLDWLNPGPVVKLQVEYVFSQQIHGVSENLPKLGILEPKIDFKFLPRPERLAAIVHKRVPTLFKFWEVHGSYLGSRLNQPVKLVLVVGVPKIVEAGAEDGQAQVAVGGQEPGHLLGTTATGAPGHIPGDLVLFASGQHFQQLGVEPVEEAFFSMDVILFSEDPLVKGDEFAALYPVHFVAQEGVVPAVGVA